jgi:hypothetical protein
MVNGASISVGKGAPDASTVGPLFWIVESDAGLRSVAAPCPIELFPPGPPGLVPLEFGAPNGGVSNMLAFPSARAESQALAPSSAARPATHEVTPSPVRGALPDGFRDNRLLDNLLGETVAGGEEDTRGVLLNPVIHLPVGSGFPWLS